MDNFGWRDGERSFLVPIAMCAYTHVHVNLELDLQRRRKGHLELKDKILRLPGLPKLRALPTLAMLIYWATAYLEQKKKRAI
jgi:hypothetical protein